MQQHAANATESKIDGMIFDGTIIDVLIEILIPPRIGRNYQKGLGRDRTRGHPVSIARGLAMNREVVHNFSFAK